MFKLLRYFSVASLIAFIIVAVLLGVFYRQIVHGNLDLYLSQVPGENILPQIRADVRLKQTRIMLATADPARAEAIRAEADLVLLKPIAFGQLRDLAKRLRPTDSH